MDERLPERRDTRRRALVVQGAVETAHNAPGNLTSETLQARLGVPPDAAERILDRLTSSGILRELDRHYS